MVDTTDLVLASQTLGPTVTFDERVAAAAAAGFMGIGLRPSDYQSARADGRSAAELRRVLDDHGIAVVELEVLRDWANRGELGQAALQREQELYEVADALGGRHMLLVGDLDGGLDASAEQFAGICDRAAEHSLLVVIEFIPWYTVNSAQIAWDIVRTADRPNGGILLDTWHHFRMGGEETALRSMPPGRIMAVQIDDADPPVGDVMDDTRHRRRLPGQGTFDLLGFVRLLDELGVRVPYGVEVLSDPLHALPAGEAAHLAAETTRSLLARARAQA